MTVTTRSCPVLSAFFEISHLLRAHFKFSQKYSILFLTLLIRSHFLRYSRKIKKYSF